jgi:hypothetical protein
MLDPSTVIGRNSGITLVDLSGSTPEVIVAGPNATVTPLSGVALSAAIGNDFQPGSWAAVSGSQAVAARRAFKLGGPDHCILSVVWS